MSSLLARATTAFLLLPGMVAFVIPLLVLTPTGPGALVDPSGIVLLGFGTGLLLWCVREFYVAGKGTLAPWAPPHDLVVTGPYRFSRNPMYVAVLVVLGGWTLSIRSLGLALSALAVMLAFHLRVVFYEEPWLARTHGETWTTYRARVPRWIVVTKPRHGP